MNKNKKADELNCRKYIANVVGADDSVCPKKHSGITLIALVITIIVMLILVGVTVSVAINGGLFGTAKQATVEMRASQVEEQVETWKAAKEASNYIEGSSAQTLEELLNDLEAQNLITKEEKAEIEEIGQVTIGTKNIVFWNISDYVYVGDYVNYEPQSETTSYKVEGIYSGYTDEEGNPQDQDINQDELKWRVLNINDNETIDLISDTVTSSDIYLFGVLGYNNGVYLLNDFCNVLYSNTNYGATARSLKIEDIENKMNLEEWDYHNYSEADVEGVQYGDSITLESNRNYPYQWAQEKSETNAINGNLIQGNLNRSEQYVPITETVVKGIESLTVTETYWSKKLYENNFKIAETRNSDKDSNIYYDLLMKSNNNLVEFWLATRCVHIRPNDAWFQIVRCRSAWPGGVAGISSLEDENGGSAARHYVRPIVTIPIKYINLSTDYSEVGAWNLK